MNLKIRNIVLILFLLSFLATLFVYFQYDRNMRLTWIFAAISALCYLIHRFIPKR
jgi:hypothetical protein